MQESTIEENETAVEEPSRSVSIKGVLSTVVGAVVALALLLTLGVWFYRLGVRDAQNVPIIRAALDPVKVRPEDPGGTETPHQDITSYQVAESEPIQSASAVIAPAPPEPRPEDVAMGDLAAQQNVQPVAEPEQTAEIVQPAVPSTGDATAPDISAQPDASSDALQAEIDRQVIAVLSESDSNPQTPAVSQAPSLEDAALTTSEPAEPEAQSDTDTAVEDDPAPVLTGTAFAPAISPAAPQRPRNLLARVEEAKQEAAQSVTNLASRAANSRVQVQLAADPDESAIRQQWRRIYNANSDVLRDRALAVQQTISGGTTFYRLRVGPFKDTSEARAVCEALKARGQDCIVARNG